MNSRFKFPRRVRIHGGECGAVARALHHEAKIHSLPAVKENVFFTTNERKSMSTKTTLKRIALVAVSAMGLGMLITVAPAQAAARTLSVNVPSVTVVKGSTSPTAAQPIANFRFTVKDENGDDANLVSGESITVTLNADGLPAAVTGFTPATTDFTFVETIDRVLGTPETALAVETTKRTDGIITHQNSRCSEPIDGDWTGNYCIGIAAADADPATNRVGFYTFTARMGTSTVIYAEVTFKLKYVSSAADSGAVITVATAGALTVGSNYANAAANSTSDYIYATLKDANAGYVINADTSTASTVAPTLTIVSKETNPSTAVTTEVHTQWNASDTGTAFDYGSSTGVKANNGIYGINMNATAVAHNADYSPATIEVRYGASVGTATIAVNPTASINAASSSMTVTGTGLYNSTAAETVTAFKATEALTWNAPLTTTSVTIKVTGRDQTTAVANQPLTFTVTWTGNASGAVTPISGVSGRQVVRTDSSGNASITITQTSPLQGSQAVVAITGAEEGTFGSQTILWKAPELTALTPSVTAFKAIAGQALSVKILAKDQFANPMSGVIMQPSFSSASKAYGSAATNAARPTITSAADGYATFSWTGSAAAVADDVDAVSFTSTYGGVSSKSSGTITVTYVAALPVISTLTGHYNTSQATSSSGTWVDLFSTTPIGAVTALTLQPTLNYSLPIVVTGTDTADSQVKFRVRALTSASAAATGVPVTVTASAGGHFTDSCTGAAGTVVTSKVCYPDSTGYIYINTIGTGLEATYTFTAGSVSTSQTIKYATATANARYVTLTGTAKEAIAKVTDRFGNPVSGIAVQISTSSGTLGGGQRTSSYNTTSDGTVSVTVEADGAATLTAYATTANDHTSLAGYVGASAVDSTLTAGVRTVTLAVTGTGNAAKNAADAATKAAEEASDAAAEAIDAANAATDAANLAAEAADAATVAAEEARDAADAATAAVEELATQVATLMAALKAQITTLANTVAKIAKKVKA